MVDADRSLRRMLGELKEDLTAMRRDLARWHSRECRGARRSAAGSGDRAPEPVNADTHAAADRLLGQIEEYDAPGG
jgi:hypothetical protein